MTQLCAAFEISRKTGYKWLGRSGSLARKACTTSRGRRSSTAVQRQWSWWSGSWRRRRRIRCGGQRRSWRG
nr:hypothetical protein [Mesorhizobium sp.]